MNDNKKQENKIEEKKDIKKRKLSGVVVSSAMEKTVVVNVLRVKIDPKYKKRYAVSKKYKVHDEKNKFKKDDKISFVECRPLSKDKKWRAIYN